MQPDFDKYLALLTAFIDAPTWKAAAILLAVLTMAALIVARYFWEENKRKEEAYKESLKIKETQDKNLKRLQQEVTKAFLDNIDAAYKQDFDYYREKISQEKYDAIWGKIPTSLHEEIASFVYKDDLKPEEKSARIILVVRRK